jgi:NAD-dependent deacetylase
VVDSQTQAAAKLLAEKLREARAAAALSGAGMSAESGIATFRSGPDALWRNIRPEEIATPQAFARDPSFVWQWYRERLQKAAGAQPNAGHRALVEIARSVSDFTVITQNVDGLHAAAGSQAVIELHGNVRRARCTGCGDLIPAPTEGALPPLCACGALLRPDVVWFGEFLPDGVMEEATAAVRRSDVVMVLGTSAQVYPAAGLVDDAQTAGAFVAEVNPEMTPASDFCDISVRAKTGEFLPLVVELLL